MISVEKSLLTRFASGLAYFANWSRTSCTAVLLGWWVRFQSIFNCFTHMSQLITLLTDQFLLQLNNFDQLSSPPANLQFQLFRYSRRHQRQKTAVQQVNHRKQPLSHLSLHNSILIQHVGVQFLWIITTLNFAHVFEHWPGSRPVNFPRQNDRLYQYSFV